MAEPRLISNKWLIIRTIGHGAMGSVYEVQHKTVRNLRRAIKQLNPRFQDTPEIAKRFLKEAERLVGLSQDEKEDHYIVRVYDFDDADANFGPYLVMELIDGQDLKRFMEANHRLPFPEVCRIGSEIAVALQYAHERGLIHRDIKPANILIEHAGGRAVVTDFGIAKQIESEAEESMTGTREFVGTVRYSSPEQIRNERSEPVDQRADIYSLGVVLYEMSSGRQFLEGMAAGEIMHRVGFEESWEAPLTFPSDIPPEFTDLVRGCLQRHRDQRVPRAAAVVERLRQCAALEKERSSLETIVPGLSRVPPTVGSIPVAVSAAGADTAVATEAETVRPVPHEEPAEDPTTVVGLRATIAASRAEMEPHVNEFERLRAEAEALGLPLEDAGHDEDAAAALRELDAFVEQARDRDELRTAQARLERIHDGVTAANQTLRNSLRGRIEQTAAALRENWTVLADEGGALVAADAGQRFTRLALQIDTHARENDWTASRAAVAEAQRFLDAATSEVRQHTAAVVDERFAAMAQAAAELAALTGSSQGEGELDRLRAAATVDVEGGHFREATSRMDVAWRTLSVTLEEQRQAIRQRLEGARAHAAELRESFDQHDRAMVSEAFAQALEAITRAEDAERNGELRTAELRYEAAVAALETCRAEVQRSYADQQERTVDDLRALLQQALAVSDEALGPTRADAEQLVDAPPPASRAAIAALEQTRAALASALVEAPHFADAERQRAATLAAEERVLHLEPPAALVALPRQLSGEADRAYAERLWQRAAQSYSAALDAFVALEQQLLAQREEQKASAAQARLTALLGMVDVDAAESLAPAELAQARAIEARARQAHARNAWSEAASIYDEAVNAYALVRDRLAQAQSARIAQLADELQELAASVPETPADIVAAPRQAAQQLVESARQNTPATNPSATIASMERAKVDLAGARQDAADYAGAAEERTAADAQFRDLKALQPTRRQTREIERLLESAANDFAGREWNRAREQYTRAAQQIAALRRELQTRAEHEQAAALRARAETRRTRIDRTVAGTVALPALEAADAHLANAQEAEQRGEYLRAREAFEAAERSYEAVEAAVAQHYHALAGQARKELEALITEAENDPAEVVAETAARARTALATEDPEGPQKTLTALAEARAALQRSRAEVPLFTEMTAARTAAAELSARLGALRVPRASMKSVDRLMKSAGALAAQRDWPKAAAAYVEARDRIAAVIREAETAPAPSGRPRWQAGLGLAALVGAAIVAVVVLRSAPTKQVARSSEPANKAPAVAKVEPQAPPAVEAVNPPVAPWRIDRFVPAEADLKIQDTSAQRFSITAAGGAPGERSKIRWLLDDVMVANDTSEWQYQPALGSAGKHRVAATVQEGKDAGQMHAWNVIVEHLNRRPVLVAASPDPHQTIETKAGAVADLRANVSDPDGDTLTYVWDIDGKATGANTPELKVPVDGNHRVSLTTSDGHEQITTTWKIAAIAPFVFEFSPKQLRRVQFKETQEFDLMKPPGSTFSDLSYAWQLDGNTVANAPKFVFKATDPRFVREAPLKLAATAKDAQGRTFSHEWEFAVLPPAPQIVASAPSDRTVESDGGSPLGFTLTAGEPVGSQKLTYVYQVDGKEGQHTERSRFEYRPSDDASHEIVAFVQDNFGQTSAQRVSWKLTASSIEPKVHAWLQEFESARRNKDADKEGQLRNLPLDQVAKLKAAYRFQDQLKIRVSSAKIERLSGNRASASFDIEQSFVDPNGNAQAGQSRCRFTFELANGKLNYLTGPCESVR